MKRCLPLLLATALILYGPGCAYFNGLAEPHRVRIETTIPGASVWVDGEAQPNTTPCWVALSPSRDHRVEARLTLVDGTVLRGRTRLDRSVRAGWIVLDYLLIGSVAVLFDWYTGALYGFDRQVARILLRPGPPPAKS